MICKLINGKYACQQESKLFFLLREFDLGHTYHFPLVLLKVLLVIFCLFLTTHVHNNVSKQFLLAICAPVGAEIATNIVMNVLFLVQYFPDPDTVDTFLRLQKTFEVVVGDIFVLSCCTYLILNILELKYDRIIKKTTFILIFQALVLSGSVLGILLTLTNTNFTRLSIYFFSYHILVIVTCIGILIMGSWEVVRKYGRTTSNSWRRLLEGLVILTHLGVPMGGILLLYPYYEEHCRLALKFSPIIFLPISVLFLPAFRKLFYCSGSEIEMKNTIIVKPGWTENQYKLEKTRNGMVLVLPPCSRQTRVPLRSQLPDYSKLPYSKK